MVVSNSDSTLDTSDRAPFDHFPSSWETLASGGGVDRDKLGVVSTCRPEIDFGLLMELVINRSACLGDTYDDTYVGRGGIGVDSPSLHTTELGPSFCLPSRRSTTLSFCSGVVEEFSVLVSDWPTSTFATTGSLVSVTCGGEQELRFS